MSLANARLRAARAAIAAACLDALPPARLGAVLLRDDQRRTLARAARALAQQGGCLIGDDVGRGKTYVALAIARDWSHPLVVAPAALRATWRVAMERAEVRCAFVSHEWLSRGGEVSTPMDGIIADESHHFRTTTTRRYGALTRLAARAPIVLLSATPLQNRPRDLAAQIALFHGERAFALGVDALSRYVIRGDDISGADFPDVLEPEWLTLDADDGAVLRAILALPPPARPLDGGDAGALRAIGLVRAWASSRAALQAALRARRRIATAIAQGADDGRAPTRSETRAWHAADDAVQLGFPAILMRASPSDSTLAELRTAIDDDRLAMHLLTGALRASADPDVARVVAIRQLREAHAASRIIAFSEYASTVTALFSAMRGDAGVGMLTAREARIASGRVTRDELLARFAPRAQGARTPAAHENVTLLLATDLLAEGVNLQDASIVVHLDLPWNPARLAQRVGRLRRPGGATAVRTYLLAPPANAAALLDADARLRHKLATAERVVGVGFAVLPALSTHALTAARDAAGSVPSASATCTGAFLRQLEQWRRPASAQRRPAPRCIVVGADASATGWFAALNDGRVISSTDGRTSDSIEVALRLASLAEGNARALDPQESRAARLALRTWLEAELLATTCGITGAPGPLRRGVLEWLASLTRSLRRHERAVVLPLIARLRNCLCLPLPLGTEQVLADLARQAHTSGGEAVEMVTTALRIAGASARGEQSAERAAALAEPVALILFAPSPSGPTATRGQPPSG